MGSRQYISPQALSRLADERGCLVLEEIISCRGSLSDVRGSSLDKQRVTSLSSPQSVDECCLALGLVTLTSVRELQVNVACQALEPGYVLSELLLSSCS